MKLKLNTRLLEKNTKQTAKSSRLRDSCKKTVYEHLGRSSRGANTRARLIALTNHPLINAFRDSALHICGVFFSTCCDQVGFQFCAAGEIGRKEFSLEASNCKKYLIMFIVLRSKIMYIMYIYTRQVLDFQIWRQKRKTICEDRI